MTNRSTDATGVADVDAGPVISLDSRPESLTSTVYAAIRQAIIDRRLPANMRATEAALAAQLNVSKTPVREALLRLKQIGLIETDGPNAGRIVSPSYARMRDAYEVREALESAAARAAAERGNGSLLLTAQQRAAEALAAAEAQDFKAYRLADDAFHSAVAAAGSNQQLARLIDDSNALISALRQRDVPELDASMTCARQHLLILESLLEGHSNEASSRMAQHVRYVRDAVLNSLRIER